MKRYIINILINIVCAAVNFFVIILSAIMIDGILVTPPLSEQIAGWLLLAAAPIGNAVLNLFLYRRIKQALIKKTTYIFVLIFIFLAPYATIYFLFTHF